MVSAFMLAHVRVRACSWISGWANVGTLHKCSVDFQKWWWGKLMPEKLSKRMSGVIAKCKTCGGTGSYEVQEFDEPMACMRCCDWLQAIKQVEELEKEIEALKSNASRAICLIHQEDNYDGGMELLSEMAGLPVREMNVTPTTLAKIKERLDSDGFR
jgi:hypothetical protein